ncbi:Rieske 2Fe-2S domain-containing protein [Methylococcus sp. EFPC2]|uniref:Rieske 2Fe-2S domain-containing protein n=1 Tax=Methylococcus sp. EFPC2 TaxID=2812648 RepID=UPI0019679948|nr:Rieske 2Fe-2S domain-containing protein [Methylococcus sp. EFPC2]QSA99274.1 Rieske 2Fe-2S domain-containing protein [Methylococcus sp. EFPC2]
MFTKACDENELKEGKYEVVAVNRTLMLIVWPQGDTPKAYQGMCPHDHEPLADAHFDGKILTCRHHDWAFKGDNGVCIKGKPCLLAEYPLKVENGEVFVDTEGVTANFIN